MVLLTGLADRLKFAPGDLKSLFAVVNLLFKFVHS